MPAGTPVLALGDSLTFGTGTSPDNSYPAVLAKLTGWNVANAGVPGDTSAGARSRLPGLMQELAPRLVLVGIGGNDFLRRLSTDETRTNIRALCTQAAAGGTQVLLIAIPELSLVAAATGRLSDHPMYNEIAGDLQLPLHAGAWSKVLGDASLKSDPIHANAQGYEAFARGLAATLKEAGYWAG